MTQATDSDLCPCGCDSGEPEAWETASRDPAETRVARGIAWVRDNAPTLGWGSPEDISLGRLDLTSPNHCALAQVARMDYFDAIQTANYRLDDDTITSGFWAIAHGFDYHMCDDRNGTATDHAWREALAPPAPQVA